MHTKVFQIGAVFVLLAFLSGVGLGAIDVYKPQNPQENATITSVSALGSNSVNSCTIDSISSLFSTSIINFPEATSNNFFQTSNNIPGVYILRFQSPAPNTINSAITTLTSSLIPFSTTNNNIIRSSAPFVTSLSSLRLAIPTILAGLAVLGLLLSKRRKIPKDAEVEDKEEDEKDEVFNN